jgi:DNA-binding NtrC family response regulator
MFPATILFASGKLPDHLVIRGHLSEMGYKLYCPADIAELRLILLMHPRVDFVIFSSDLPGLENLIPVRNIRENYPATPILLLMNSINIETMRLANIMGCNEVIKDPVSARELDLILSKYFAKSQTN